MGTSNACKYRYMYTYNDLSYGLSVAYLGFFVIGNNSVFGRQIYTYQ